MSNPLLALDVQAPSIDIGGSIGRGQELQTISLGNALKAYQIQQAQRTDERANALQQVYKQIGPGLASGDEGAINKLATLDPSAAVDFRGKALEQKTATSSLAQSDFKLQSAKNDHIAGVMGAVVDAPDVNKPLAYKWARQQLVDAGNDVSKMPESYSPDILPQLQATRQAALSAKDQIDNQQKAATATEAGRHNVADENNTRRGQDMTDARARELAENTNPFGKGMNGKAYAILAQGAKDPSQRATPEYMTAWQILSKPRVDPNTGTIVYPDLSAYQPPTGAAANGGAEQSPTIKAFAPPNPSQPEAAAAGYANRLAESSKQIDAHEAAGTSAIKRSEAKIPIAGNYMVGADYQQLDQAERNFINAQLRRESGAAISESEFENARKQYLPVPGDTKEVLAQKRDARAMATQNMQLSAGNVLLPPGVVQSASPPKGAPVVPQQQGFGKTPSGATVSDWPGAK